MSDTNTSRMVLAGLGLITAVTVGKTVYDNTRIQQNQSAATEATLTNKIASVTGGPTIAAKQAEGQLK